MELRYEELGSSSVTVSAVNDINRLLAQLSPNARLCTEAYLHQLLGSGTRVFVAIDGSRIVGTVLLVPAFILAGRKDWIEDVVVDDAYRRRGIAGSLMNLAERASREGGAMGVNLTSVPSRADARAMYEARGYHLRDTGVFRLPL